MILEEGYGGEQWVAGEADLDQPFRGRPGFIKRSGVDAERMNQRSIDAEEETLP